MNFNITNNELEQFYVCLASEMFTLSTGLKSKLVCCSNTCLRIKSLYAVSGIYI